MAAIQEINAAAEERLSRFKCQPLGNHLPPDGTPWRNLGRKIRWKRQEILTYLNTRKDERCRRHPDLGRERRQREARGPLAHHDGKSGIENRVVAEGLLAWHILIINECSFIERPGMEIFGEQDGSQGIGRSGCPRRGVPPFRTAVFRDRGPSWRRSRAAVSTLG